MTMKGKEAWMNVAALETPKLVRGETRTLGWGIAVKNLKSNSNTS